MSGGTLQKVCLKSCLWFVSGFFQSFKIKGDVMKNDDKVVKDDDITDDMKKNILDAVVTLTICFFILVGWLAWVFKG